MAKVGQVISELSKLKTALKEAKSELIGFDVGTSEFASAQKKVAELTDQLGDLNDATRINGTGVERLQSSFSVLGESFKNLDLDKLKLGIQGIGGAMKAVPILALVSGITMLAEKFDIFGKIATFITGIVNNFTDALGFTAIAAEKASQSTIKSLAKSQDAVEKRYESEIKLAAAAGENTSRLEIEKLKSVENSTQLQLGVLNVLKDKKGKLNDDELKQYQELQDKLYLATSDRLAKEVAVQKSFRNIIEQENINAQKLGLSEREKEIFDSQKKTDDKLKALNDISFKQGIVDSEQEAKAYNKAENTILEEGRKERAAINKKYDDEAKKARKKAFDDEMAAVDYNLIQKQKEVDTENKIKIEGRAEEQDNAIKYLEEDDALKNYWNKATTEEDKKAEANRTQNKIDAAAERKKIEEQQAKSAIATINTVSSYIQQVGSVITQFMQLQKQELDSQLEHVNNQNAIALQNLQYNRDVALQDLQVKQQEESDILDANQEKALAREGLTAEQKDKINSAYNKKKRAQENKAARETAIAQRKALLDEYALKLAQFTQEQALKKQIFEQDKKIKIANLVISTITGSLQAVSAGIQAFGLPYGAVVGGVIAAGITAAGAVGVNNIRKQKFEEGVPPAAPVLPPIPKDTGSAGGDSGAGDSATVNRRTLFSTGQSQGLVIDGGQGERAIRAYVVEQDITDAQQLNKVIESKSGF